MGPASPLARCPVNAAPRLLPQHPGNQISDAPHPLHPIIWCPTRHSAHARESLPSAKYAPGEQGLPRPPSPNTHADEAADALFAISTPHLRWLVMMRSPSCNIIPLQAGSSQCTLVPALRQCGPKSCCNSAWALSRDLVLLFKSFLSAAYPSSDSTDYKNTFKEKVFTWISFMSCCIQHRLGESYLAGSRHDSHWNKGHGKAKATVKQGSMAWANFLDRDKPFSLFVDEEPQAGHQAFKYLRTTARAIYTTLAQTDAVVCKIQNIYLFIYLISKTVSWVLVSPATRRASQQAACRNPPASLWAQGSSQADTPTPCFVEHTQSLCSLDQLPSS